MSPTDWPLRPGPQAGAINPRTLTIRPRHSLNDEERTIARYFLVECGWDFVRIAAWLRKPEIDVRLALMTVRLRHPEPKRKALNVSLGAHAHVASARLPGEATWQTINRLLGL